MSRRIVTAVALVAVGGVLAAPALAAPKPKPFKKSFTYTDPTPDPTYVADPAGACHGMLPQEAPLVVTVPAKGTLKVALKNIGDWALEVRDSKGRTLASSDGGTPEAEEATTVRVKKPGKYSIIPCNIGGAPTSEGTYEYKPS